jgi:hypothetical protein
MKKFAIHNGLARRIDEMEAFFIKQEKTYESLYSLYCTDKDGYDYRLAFLGNEKEKAEKVLTQILNFVLYENEQMCRILVLDKEAK